jgi:hypothetical protein
MSRYVTVCALCCLAGVVVLLGVSPMPFVADAADHGDAPLLLTDTRFDINDVYVFQSPADSSRTVMVATHNPLAGISSPVTFHPDVKYDFLIDNDGDARPDIRFRFRFGLPDPDNLNRQMVTMVTRGLAMNLSISGMTSGAGSMNSVALGTTQPVTITSGDVSISAGLFDDPFFFDFIPFRRGIVGTNPFNATAGTDFFAGLNVMAIVLEVPTSLITSGGSSNIGFYARTLINGLQVDRNGRPVINGALIAGGRRRNEFNAALPRNDVATFRPEVVTRLVALGHTTESANGLLDTVLPGGGRLLPDILTIDTSTASGFPNGRQLADDVIDAALGLVTAGRITTDNVGNTSTFLNTFPYLANANN